MREISRTKKKELNELERPEREKKARAAIEEKKKEEEKRLEQLAEELKKTYINEAQRQKTIEENQKRRDRDRERQFTLQAIRNREKQIQWQQKALLRKKQIETENKRAQIESASAERERAQQNKSHTIPTEEILDPYWCHRNRYDFNGSYVTSNPKGIYDEKGNILDNCHIENTTTL